MAKKPSLGFYGSGGQFTLIYRELRMSDAYRVLTPKQKLILVDMIRIYRKASAGDKQYPKAGFEYVWEVCEEDVSESAFYRIRQRLVDLGFFEYPADIQTMKAGTARRFLPSREWANYKATLSEATVLARCNKAKKDRIRDKQRRMTKFRTSLDKNRSGVSERGRSTMLERGRSSTVESESTCSKEADPDPKSANSHMLERGRCSNTIPISDSGHRAMTVYAETADDADELLTEISLENRMASLQTSWPGEKPNLGLLLSPTSNMSRKMLV